MKKQYSFSMIMLLGLAVLITGPVCAQIVYVDIDAVQTPDGTSWATAHTDIQSALDATTPPAEIWVAEGIYAGGTIATVQINYPGFSIYGGFNGTESAREERNPNLYPTAIDGAAESPCVNIAASTVLDGFRLSNGYNGNGDGGGVIVNATGATIRNCIFYNNESSTSGGGLYISDADCTVENCSFSSNTAQSGAAVYHYSPGAKGFVTTSTFINCVFVDNHAMMSGVFLNDNVFMDFLHCTFYNNLADTDFLFQFGFEGQLTLTNSIIADQGIGLFSTGHTAVITASYTRTPVFIAGTGNITGDPLMVDPWNGNYNLDWNSPCRDVAPVDPRAPTDIVGVARPQGALADMGVFELIQTGSITLLGADPIYLECPEAFVDPGAEALDDDLSPLTVTVDNEVIETAPGEYTVTYSATSSQGTPLSVTRTVIVEDTTPPVITLYGDATTSIP